MPRALCLLGECLVSASARTGQGRNADGSLLRRVSPWEEIFFQPSHAYSKSMRTSVVTLSCLGLGFRIVKCDNRRDLWFVRPREPQTPTGELQLPRSARGASPRHLS